MTSVADERRSLTYRRVLVQGGSTAVRRTVIPVIQLSAAGLTLGLWLVVNQQVSADYEVLVVKVFSYSAVLALTLTAGIAYVLPNLFRVADRETWSGTGAWSTPVAIAATLNRVCALGGAALAVVAIAVPELRVVAATLAASAVLSTALLTAQLARLQDSKWGMAVALSPNPFIPFVFLVLHGLGVPLPWAVAVFCGVALGLDEAIMARYRPMITPVSELDRGAARSVMGSAGPLIPHLLCFAAIMQGPRLVEALRGSDTQLVASHQVMLLVAIGTTVVTSFHGYISVSLQATRDDQYHGRLRSFGLQYATIGALAALTVAVLLVVVAPAAIDDFPDLTWPGRLAVIAALPTISTYYALSAQLVRSGRTSLLATVSGLTLGLYALVSFVAPAASASEAFVRYGVALLAMPVVLWVVAGAVDASQRLPLARLLGTAALGFVPVVAIGLGIAVAAGVGGAT